MDRQLFENLGSTYDTKVEQAIKKILDFKPTEENIYTKFCKTLLDTGCVIYNELVINAISPFNKVNGDPYKPNILYIYATYVGAVAINNFIKTEMFEIIHASNQSVEVDATKPFKHSIHRNKRVKAVLKYKNKRNPYSLIVKIVDDIPSNVVLKEELTFLQTFFDGKNVKSTHPKHVIDKVGTLNEEYLPLVGWNEFKENEEDEDKNYRDYGGYAGLTFELYKKRNFKIDYDTKSIVIRHGYLYGKEVSGEEHLISYLHGNLVNILVNDKFKKMVDIGHDENTDITVADIYLRWFYLKELTTNEFMKIIKRLANEGKFLLPLWVQDTYKKNDDIINALVVHTCSLEDYFIQEMYSGTKDTRKANEFAVQVIKDIKSYQKYDDDDFLKNPKITALLNIIKKLIIQKYISLTFEYTYETDVELSRIFLSQKDFLYTFFSKYGYDNKEIKEFTLKFLVDWNCFGIYGYDKNEIKQFALSTKFLFDFGTRILSKNSEAYKEIYDQYYKKLRKGSVEEFVKIFKNYEQVANYEKYMSQKEDKERLKSNTRNIPALNIVKPSRTHTVDYDEKDRMLDKKCTDVSNQSLYDMNKYLKGESVEAYTTNGERYNDEDLEVVNPQEAMKRLIFFLAESADLTELNPYCYNLDKLTDDIGAILTVECKDHENYQGLEYLFGHNPIIRLNFEYPVYVPLSEILDAIYNTKKQVFILIPTEKTFRYTASMAIQFKTVNSRVSGDHCQKGSSKDLHTIKVCKGTEKNACWPVNEAIELNEVYPDIYYMKQKFYVWSKSENSMGAQFAIANNVINDREIKKENNKKRQKRREANGTRSDGTEDVVSDDEEIEDPWWAQEDRRSRSVSPFIPRTPSPRSPRTPSPSPRSPRTPSPSPRSPRSPFSEISTYDDEDANAQAIRQQNIPRTSDEIRAHLLTRLPPDMSELIGDIPDIIALNPIPNNSYHAAEQMLNERLYQLEADSIFDELQQQQNDRRFDEQGDSEESPDTLRQLSNLTFGTDSNDEDTLDTPDVRRQLLDLFGRDSDDEESHT